MDLHRKLDESNQSNKYFENTFTLEDLKLLLASNLAGYRILQPAVLVYLEETGLEPVEWYPIDLLGLLEADLAFLGKDVAIEPASPILLSDKSSLLGALYVVYGSTHGSKIIHGKISSRTDLEGFASSFFAAMAGSYFMERFQWLIELETSEVHLPTFEKSLQATYRLFLPRNS